MAKKKKTLIKNLLNEDTYDQVSRCGVKLNCEGITKDVKRYLSGVGGSITYTVSIEYFFIWATCSHFI